MVAHRREVTSRAGAVAALAVSAWLVAATGCASKQSIPYHWGRYEQLVYEMYSKPGKADPATQIAKLTEDIARAQAGGRRVPPGVHAHLGYLYYTQGQVDLAAEQFSIEKELFPEATVFVDGIVARMSR